MELQHDPRTKQQVKDLLYDLLYRPVLGSFRKRLLKIVHKNCQLQKTTHPSFIYRAEVYIAEESIKPPPHQLTPLHASLVPEMQEYLKEMAYLNSHELPYVIGYINQVLNSSDDLPDYIRLLPDSIHAPIQKLIATCGCRTTQLAQEDVELLKERNAVPIELMKQRLVLNLLL